MDTTPEDVSKLIAEEEARACIGEGPDDRAYIRSLQAIRDRLEEDD